MVSEKGEGNLCSKSLDFCHFYDTIQAGFTHCVAQDDLCPLNADITGTHYYAGLMQCWELDLGLPVY